MNQLFGTKFIGTNNHFTKDTKLFLKFFLSLIKAITSLFVSFPKLDSREPADPSQSSVYKLTKVISGPKCPLINLDPSTEKVIINWTDLIERFAWAAREPSTNDWSMVLGPRRRTRAENIPSIISTWASAMQILHALNAKKKKYQKVKIEHDSIDFSRTRERERERKRTSLIVPREIHSFEGPFKMFNHFEWHTKRCLDCVSVCVCIVSIRTVCNDPGPSFPNGLRDHIHKVYFARMGVCTKE